MRPLGADEAASFGLSGDLGARVRIQVVPVLWPSVNAITLGRVILVRRRALARHGAALVAHELVHVMQYQRLGMLRFLGRYLSEYVRGLWRFRRHRLAYMAISFEEQARAAANKWQSTGESLVLCEQQVRSQHNHSRSGADGSTPGEAPAQT